jgi:cytochrome c-type biogenesis protein CcmH
MTVWIAIAVIAAVALAMLLAPLLRRDTAQEGRAAFDARVYRDQLAEVQRDAERGVITGAEAEAARTEIARRLLAADDAAKADAGPKQTGRSSLTALMVAICVPAMALFLYLAGGAPDLPGRPAPAVTATTGGDGRSMEALVAELGQKLAQRPDDARGWALYARSLASLGRMAEAAPAYQRAAGLEPNNADLQAQLGEALAFARDGTITPEARATFDRALALDPKEPRARYYMGLADRQAGRTRAAFDRWLALEADSAPDAPWRGLLRDRLARLAQELGIDAASLATLREKAGTAPPAIAASPALRGPSTADVEAAQSMSAEDRTLMIRGMVAGLAERMKQTPDDAAGWERLARSYQVLGEAEKRTEALGQLARLRPNDLNSLGEYAAALAGGLTPDERVPPALVDVSGRILAIAPDQPGALFYAGLARAQAGDRAGALAHWEKLLSIAPADAPIVQDLKRRIEALDKAPQ